MIPGGLNSLMHSSSLIPITCVNTDAQNYTASGTSASVSGVNIGTASADRLVVCVISCRRDATTTITGITIGGVSATVSPNVGNTTTNLFYAWARVPTGTTATVAWTFDQSGPVGRLHVYTITGQTSDTPTINTGLITTAGTARSSTQTIADRSAIIAADSCANNAFTDSWSGTMALTRDVQGQWNGGGAYSNLTTASRAVNSGALGSVTATQTWSSSPTTPKMNLAVWR